MMIPTKTRRSPAPPAALPVRPAPAAPARSLAVRQILHGLLHGPRVQRSPDDAVLEESERMRDQTRRHIREGLKNKVDDLQQFPFTTKDPDRGFRPQDLAQLDKARVSLTFAGNLSPLPADAQKLLLGNIAATVRFALDPKDPGRVAELKRLQAELKAQGKSDQFFDQPAGRADATDLYHGHVCVPKAVLDKSKTLQKLRQSPYSGFGSGASAGDDIQKAIGKEVPTTRPEARDVMDIVGRHREPFLKALAPLLKALASEPEAGILYHSWEVDRPAIGKRRMASDHPVRTLFTPLSAPRPKLGNRDCQTLINFAFHVDRRGRITLFPGSEKGMVRALEILRGWGTPP
jgi:hypothetical protein